MDWNYIKVFLAVCETGSLVKAARYMGVSHATVFRHISSLEKQSGSRLFERINGKYVLTQAGLELREISLNISNAFDEIDRRVSHKDGTPEGIVRLTSPRSFADKVLPGYLADFNSQYPDIEVELLTSNAELNLSERSADIALRVSHSPIENLWGRRVLNISWSIYASPTYLATSAPLTCVEDLKSHRILAPTGQLQRHPAYQLALQEDYQIAATKSDDLTTLASLAAAGHGVALLPDDLKTDRIERCFPYPGIAQNKLWVLTHPDLRHTRRISILMKFLANAFSKDLYWKR